MAAADQTISADAKAQKPARPTVRAKPSLPSNIQISPAITNITIAGSVAPAVSQSLSQPLLQNIVDIK